MAKTIQETNEMESQRLSALKTLEASYLMYENTLADYDIQAASVKTATGDPMYDEKKRKNNKELIEGMRDSVVAQYVQIGGKVEDLEKLKKKNVRGATKQNIADMIRKEKARDELREYMQAKQVKAAETPVEEREEIIETNNPQRVQEPVVQEADKVKDEDVVATTSFNDVPNIGTRKMYDVVKLPSKGQCYPNKQSTIKVSFLTAYDENMILSPNLYKDGTFIDYLLHAKVIDENFNPDDLVQGDRDAIIIWLRATGYGPDYPIIVTDDVTGKEFETSVDLSKINYKKFKLKGDDNGHFAFTMPTTKDVVKFRYLTQADLKKLQKLKERESKFLNVSRLKQYASDLLELSKDNDILSEDTLLQIKAASNAVTNDIGKNYDEDKDMSFSHELTDRLIMQTVSVNGIKDYDYIRNYILNLNVKDAKDYRDYMRDNEPGIDYNIEVKRPLSLGGGSIKSFLQLDQFVFITV